MNRIFIFLIILLFGNFGMAKEIKQNTNWGYTGKVGPTYWGLLRPDSRVCSTGKLQSPIDINGKITPQKNQLEINYQPSSISREIIYDGRMIQLNFSKDQDQNSIYFVGVPYHLIQFHFHVPSENKLKGKKYPLEIHIVHQNSEGKYAVIGVFAEAKRSNPIVKDILQSLPQQNAHPQPYDGNSINLLNLLPSQRDYYSFSGSLTIPPCTEGVEWIVMPDPISVSADQIDEIRTMLGGSNARPVQPLNGREIYYSK